MHCDSGWSASTPLTGLTDHSHGSWPWMTPPPRSWLISWFLTTLGGKLILFNSVNPCMLGMHKFKECTEVPKTNYLHRYPCMPRSALKSKTEQGQAPPTLKEVWWVTWAFIRPLSVQMQMTRGQLSLLKPASLKAHSSPETHYTRPHYLSENHKNITDVHFDLK